MPSDGQSIEIACGFLMETLGVSRPIARAVLQDCAEGAGVSVVDAAGALVDMGSDLL